MRLFVVLSLIWIGITAPLFWKPLPYTYDTTGVLGVPTIQPPPAINLADRKAECDYQLYLGGEDAQARQTVDCWRRIERRVESEVVRARTTQLATWASIVLFFPVILPLMLILGAVIHQWVNEGYSKRPDAP